MSKLWKNYVKEIKEELNFLATWLPNQQLALGDYGKLESGAFIRMGALTDFDIPVITSTSDKPINFKHHSRGAVGLSTVTAADAKIDGWELPAGKALLKILFERKHSIVLEAEQCIEHRINNLDEVCTEIAVRFANDEWDTSHFVISRLFESAKATILVSSDAGQSLGATVEADVAPNGLSLASIRSENTVQSANPVQVSIVGEAGLTPLYSAVGVYRRFWQSEVRIATMSGTDMPVGELAIYDLIGEP